MAAFSYRSNSRLQTGQEWTRTERDFSTKVPHLLHNLFALSNPPLDDWEQKLLSAEEAFNRPPSAYDTHPSPSERFRMVEKYGIAHLAPSFDDHRPAWELLPNAAQLQEEMTGRVQVNVDAQSDGTEEEPEE